MSVRSRSAMRAGAGALLVVFVALGVCQLGATRTGPFGADYLVYRNAAEAAWHGDNPYNLRSIGWGYLYPPPSLLLFKALAYAPRYGCDPVHLLTGLSVLALILSLVLLAGAPSWWRAAAALLLVGSSGVIESIQRGQINTLVVFLVALFVWAWGRRLHLVASLVLAMAVCLKTSPLVFAVSFLTLERWKWALVLLGFIGLFLLVAEVVIPATHLTASFLASLRWASEQHEGSYWLFNYSLSGAVPRFAERVFGTPLDWHTSHRVKLLILLLLLGVSYAGYLLRHQSRAATNALFATCAVDMVLAPNIVWLHHAALMIPGLWILLVESHSAVVVCVTLIALGCIQCVRCFEVHLAVPAYAMFGGAELILLAACSVFVMKSLRPENGAYGRDV